MCWSRTFVPASPSASGSARIRFARCRQRSSMSRSAASAKRVPMPKSRPTIRGFSGLAPVRAGSDEARPRLFRTILPDKLTAITASQAITAALLARERSGEGQHVRLSMLEAVMAFLWSSDMGGQPFVGDEPARQEAATSFDLIYETADGYMTGAPLTDRHGAGRARA